MIPDFTLVLGVDENHIKELELVLPTWMKFKPSLLKRKILVFYDRDAKLKVIDAVFEQHGIQPDYQIWPRDGVEYTGDKNTKWFHPQRYKMLAGFIHAAAMRVETEYWMKLDLDVVATGNDDWIDKSWFAGKPAIISQPWSYTKPKDQMIVLDRWARKHASLLPELNGTYPLNLFPQPDATSLPHKRIISWCSFWNTKFTKMASRMAEATCGEGKLPVPSQDGFLFYLAKRMDLGIVKPNFKRLGFQHCSNFRKVQRTVNELLQQHKNPENELS